MRRLTSSEKESAALPIELMTRVLGQEENNTYVLSASQINSAFLKSQGGRLGECKQLTFFMSDSRSVRENAVTQDYLKTIWSAEESGQAGIAVRLLASRVGVAVSTASEKVKRLVAEGLAFHEPYGKVTLTEQGRRRALEVVRRHRLLETYLHDALGFEWDEVHEEAESRACDLRPPAQSNR